jgi:short-subunit dehydrogenase
MAIDPLAPFRLDDRVAVLTGASSGLGARFARVLDGLGATVVLAARRTERLEALAGELRDAVAVRCDVGEPGANEDLVATAVDRYGRLDVVVANAGVADTLPAVKESVEGFGRVVHIDLVAQFALAKAAAGVMKGQPEGGAIVNVASAAAFAPSRAYPAYATSKAAVLMLSECLRVELADEGIGVTAICPGVVDTGIVGAARFVGVDATEAERRRTRTNRLYARRGYTADRVADAVVRAVEGRRRQVVEPRWLTPALALRGVVRPLLDRAARRYAPELERRWREAAREHGVADASRPRGPSRIGT